MPVRDFSDTGHRLLSDPSMFVFDEVLDAMFVAAKMIADSRACPGTTTIGQRYNCVWMMKESGVTLH